MNFLSYLIPGLGQLLLNQRLYGVQYLLTAAFVWSFAWPIFKSGDWFSKLLALVGVLGVHIGAGMTATADIKRPLGAEWAYAAQQTYQRWSVITAGSVVAFISGILLKWVFTLPNWSVVLQKNLVFLLIGRFRAEQYADQRWHLWGFAFLILGSVVAYFFSKNKIKNAWIPLVIGASLGVWFLFPLIIGEVAVGGLALSLILATLGILGAIPLGLLFGVGRTNKLPFFRTISTIYVETLRSLPFIQVIFGFFILLPYVLGEGTQFWAVIMALALFTGAYVAEIVRAGIQALPTGQAEAARALGLSGTQTMIQVILPQAVRNMIPPLVGQFISLFKDTSLVSIVGLLELAGAGRSVANRLSIATFEVYITVGILYFIFAYLLSLMARSLEAPQNAR